MQTYASHVTSKRYEHFQQVTVTLFFVVSASNLENIRGIKTTIYYHTYTAVRPTV